MAYMKVKTLHIHSILQMGLKPLRKNHPEFNRKCKGCINITFFTFLAKENYLLSLFASDVYFHKKVITIIQKRKTLEIIFFKSAT